MGKGCKYCVEEHVGMGGDFIVEETLFEGEYLNDYVGVKMKDKKLMTHYEGPYFEKIYFTKINYCPMCGTNLKELYKDEE